MYTTTNPASTTRESPMASFYSFQTTLQLLVFMWMLWTFLKRLVIKHPFDNIPGPHSVSLFRGNLGQVFNPQAWEFHKYLKKSFGDVVKIHGYLGDKQLYVSDPKALQHIIVKDRYVYEEPSWLIASNKLIYGISLMSTLGEHHRKQRKLLIPVFSTSHLRDMVPTFYNVTYKLRDAIALKLKGGPQDIDIFHWTSRTALELIGQAGLGYSFDDLNDEQPNKYSEAVKNLMPTTSKLPTARRLMSYIGNIGPRGFRRFLLKLLPFRNVQKLRQIVDIMDRTSTDIFQSKTAALQQGDDAVFQQIGHGKDIMSVLLKANMDAKEEDRLPEFELMGQMSTLIFAAMDSTSGLLARILHLLAQNPDIQERLRQEITEARARGGDLNYDDLTALPYLGAVIRETLRLFPSAPMTYRVARRDMILPLLKPIVGLDSTEVSEIVVPKNTNIIVAILAANRNKNIWGQDAYEWKPERWLSPLPDSVMEAHFPGIYSNMMTFLGGHACIGFKFSQLEMKVVLSLLLESFNFSLTEQEIIWNMSGVVSPIVRGGPPGKLQLPLRVTPVKNT